MSKVKGCLASLFIFNIICYIAFTGQILYTKEYAKMMIRRYTNPGLESHVNRINNLVQQCTDKYTQFDIDAVSHLFEHNDVER